MVLLSSYLFRISPCKFLFFFMNFSLFPQISSISSLLINSFSFFTNYPLFDISFLNAYNLKLTVFTLCRHQVYALREAWGMDTTSTSAEVVPLILADDLIRSLSQMKYFFNRNPTGVTVNLQIGQQPTKRIRTS